MLCRICSSENLKDIISLGEQYITSRFPVYGDYSVPRTTITLCLCDVCGLVQLKETQDCKELYEFEYGYRSGISNTMREHLHSYQKEICSIAHLEQNDTIVDIGSNDSTLLQYYPSIYNRIGVDPTGKQFASYYGDVKLLPTYFNYKNFTETYGNLKCKIVSSISMFYDLPDPVQFAKDIYAILESDGIWTCEQSYLLSMLRTNSIDTICHEHLEYYALHQIKEIATRANFKIINVSFNNCNGGSFRIYFAKKACPLYTEDTDLINRILKEENDYGITQVKTYQDFMKNVDIEIKYLTDFIDTVNKNGQQVYIYGASTKGNCLLQYGNITEKQIKYAVERNLSKIGKMTSTGIKIIDEITMRENPPHYLLVLPWHFRDEIIQREALFLNNGGQFIFPFPNFEITSHKKKLLITGCDGMIAHYVKKEMPEYNLYGIGHTNPVIEPNMVKFYFDMNDRTKLESVLSTLKPDMIIHLASISSSQYAFDHPIETLNLNGLVVAHLCDIIHKKKWTTKLFNASSSDMYKGHKHYIINEDDHYTYHSHPYSIAKIMGHSIVEFYRKTYNLPFSNGIIFTTESKHKKGDFLLGKLSRHIKQWRNDKVPITIGLLNSKRNILHGSDVAKAIKLIILQNNGDSFVISNTVSHRIYDLVIMLYEHSGITLNLRNNVLYYSNEPVINIDNIRVSDSVETNIEGNSCKLNQLGWKPLVEVNDIIKEYLE